MEPNVREKVNKGTKQKRGRNSKKYGEEEEMKRGKKILEGREREIEGV